MFYETKKKNHGLKYDPFKSCIIPRPIAWITTISKDETCAIQEIKSKCLDQRQMVRGANLCLSKHIWDSWEKAK